MPKIIPLNELPDLTPSQIQQLLFEAAESAERFAKIEELNAEIEALKQEKKEKAEVHAEEKKALDDKVKKQEYALAATKGTQEYIAAKQQEAIFLQQKAEEILTELQPQEDL